MIVFLDEHQANHNLQEAQSRDIGIPPEAVKAFQEIQIFI